MNKSHILTGLALIGVLLALALPRLGELDRFVTPDEPKWLMRSANFYHALSDFDLKNTYQHEHPGVTITWAGMGGFLRRYPQYVEIRPGQVERTEKMTNFLRNHQISPMRILAAGRFYLVIFIILTTSAAFLVSSRLLGLMSALIGFLLIAFDPFFAALSRLLHVDGLTSALMLLSVLAYLAYLYTGRKGFFLLISGVAAGLSWLTKSPAFYLLPFIGLIVLIELISSYLGHKKTGAPTVRWVVHEIWKGAAPALGWLAVAGATFFLLWPAMWVNPLGTLKIIFSQAMVYAAEGHENITFFNGQIYPVGDSAWYFYPISFVWRTTPVVLIGLGLASIGMVFRNRLSIPAQRTRVVGYLCLYAILFLIMMSLGDKKFDRYLLPAHLALDLVAGFGWVVLAEMLFIRLSDRISLGFRRVGVVLLYSSVIVWQLSGVLQTYPYYLNYYNPLLGGSARAGEVMMIGWGEGLDLAADYLNELPSAEKLRVVSWYGNGGLSYVFKGQTINMDVDMTLNDLKKGDYVVIYVNQIPRQLPNPEILRYFERLEPVHIVTIGDVEYARIYDMRDHGDT